LLERYCFFYRMAEQGWDYIHEDLTKPTIEFRHYVDLVTFGDDDVKGKTVQLAAGYSAEDQRRILSTIGMTYTPGDKTAGGAAKTKIEEISFLKRSLREEDGVWFAPIARKTLAKMLTIRMKSTMSDPDHHAQILTNVMRESFLHGRSFYDTMKAKVCKVAAKHGLDQSSKFDVGDFDQFLDDYKKGSFKSWELNLTAPPEDYVNVDLEGASGEKFKLLGAETNKNEHNSR